MTLIRVSTGRPCTGSTDAVSLAVCAYLVVDDGHVKIAQLLQSIRQIGMRLCHLSIQQYAAVIEGYALLVVPQLIVDSSNEQQQICSVSMRGIYLQICTHMSAAIDCVVSQCPTKQICSRPL